MKAFDYHQTVKTLVTDSAQDLIVAGSSDGDIKVFALKDVLPANFPSSTLFIVKEGFVVAYVCIRFSFRSGLPT